MIFALYSCYKFSPHNNGNGALSPVYSPRHMRRQDARFQRMKQRLSAEGLETGFLCTPRALPSTDPDEEKRGSDSESEEYDTSLQFEERPHHMGQVTNKTTLSKILDQAAMEGSRSSKISSFFSRTKKKYDRISSQHHINIVREEVPETSDDEDYIRPHEEEEKDYMDHRMDHMNGTDDGDSSSVYDDTETASSVISSLEVTGAPKHPNPPSLNTGVNNLGAADNAITEMAVLKSKKDPFQRNSSRLAAIRENVDGKEAEDVKERMDRNNNKSYEEDESTITMTSTINIAPQAIDPTTGQFYHQMAVQALPSRKSRNQRNAPDNSMEMKQSGSGQMEVTQNQGYNALRGVRRGHPMGGAVYDSTDPLDKSFRQTPTSYTDFTSDLTSSSPVGPDQVHQDPRQRKRNPLNMTSDAYRAIMQDTDSDSSTDSGSGCDSPPTEEMKKEDIDDIHNRNGNGMANNHLKPPVPAFGAMLNSSNSTSTTTQSSEPSREVERLRNVYHPQAPNTHPHHKYPVSRLNSTSKNSQFTTSPSSASGRLDPSKISDHRTIGGAQGIYGKSSLATVPGSNDELSAYSDFSFQKQKGSGTERKRQYPPDRDSMTIHGIVPIERTKQMGSTMGRYSLDPDNSDLIGLPLDEDVQERNRKPSYSSHQSITPFPENEFSELLKERVMSGSGGSSGTSATSATTATTSGSNLSKHLSPKHLSPVLSPNQRPQRHKNMKSNLSPSFERTQNQQNDQNQKIENSKDEHESDDDDETESTLDGMVEEVLAMPSPKHAKQRVDRVLKKASKQDTTSKTDKTENTLSNISHSRSHSHSKTNTSTESYPLGTIGTVGTVGTAKSLDKLKKKKAQSPILSPHQDTTSEESEDTSDFDISKEEARGVHRNHHKHGVYGRDAVHHVDPATDRLRKKHILSPQPSDSSEPDPFDENYAPHILPKRARIQHSDSSAAMRSNRNIIAAAASTHGSNSSNSANSREDAGYEEQPQQDGKGKKRKDSSSGSKEGKPRRKGSSSGSSSETIEDDDLKELSFGSTSEKRHYREHAVKDSLLAEELRRAGKIADGKRPQSSSADMNSLNSINSNSSESKEVKSRFT